MVMLMLHLMVSEMTTYEFFEGMIFEQSMSRKVNGVVKKDKFLLMTADEFFAKLSEIPNLAGQRTRKCIALNKFLAPNKSASSMKYILANKVKNCLTKMHSDEDIINALVQKIEEA